MSSELFEDDPARTWLPRLPAHWQRKRLKYLFSMVSGGTPSKDVLEYWMGDIPWVSPKDMKSESIEDTEDHISEEAVKKSATNRVPSGTLLIVSRSGILRHTIPVAITRRAMALNQDLKALLSRGRDVEPAYYAALLRGMQAQLLTLWRKQGATVESLETELIGETEVPVPPRSEQRAIADFLDRETAKIDALIAKQEELIERIEEKRKAAIDRAVTKGLSPKVPMKQSGIEWIGEVPKHWSVKRLKHVAPYVTSGSRGWAQYYADDGDAFIRIGNLTRHSIDLDLSDIQRVQAPVCAEGARTWLREGDLLISITAYLGSIAVVPATIQNAYVSQHIALARPSSGCVEPRYLAYFLLSNSGQAQFSTSGYGGTKEGLSLDNIRELWMTAPPLAEQTEIVAFIEQEFNIATSLLAKVHAFADILRERRAALITAAVTGQIEFASRIAHEAAA